MTRALELTVGGYILADDSGHPNEMKFTGTLVILDAPSNKAPNGAEGHKILVPRSVAQRRLKTLIGMGLNYDPDLDAHAQRRKVGVIKKAWIEGNELKVSGVVWKHDFPEATKDLKRQGLGMSMEINQVQIKDMDASVWEITDLCFLGATILYRDKAAYHGTRAIAAKADRERRTNTMPTAVATKKAKANTPAVINFQEVAEAAAKRAIAPIEAKHKELHQLVNSQTDILAQIAASLEEMSFGGKSAKADAGTIEQMETDKTAAGDVESACKDDENDDENDENDDEMDSEAVDAEVDKGDLEEMGPDTEDDEANLGEPGHFNDDAKNKGSKTDVEDKVGKTVASAQVKVLRSKLAFVSKQLEASNTRMANMEKKIARLSQQAKVQAQDTDRRSGTGDMRAASGELLGLLSKGGIDGREMMASGTKLTPDQFDRLLSDIEAAGRIRLDTVKRIELKNQALQNGMMEEGAMDRGFLQIGGRRL